jgi:hypothetical protein
MNDMLLDDVNSLLDGDFGDDRILKQIARACKNNEVISNYERNYVQKLAEQHLDKKPKILPPKKPEITPTIIPDVEIPEIEASTHSQTIQSSTFQPESSNYPKSNLKNPKLLFGFGGIAIIIIVAVIIFSTPNTDSFSSNAISDIEIQLSVQTDLSSYNLKDLISINGISNDSKFVNLSIKNQHNKLVWAEQVPVKDNGTYSTLAIAGGTGWNTSGTYTLNVDDSYEIKSIDFSFNS